MIETKVRFVRNEDTIYDYVVWSERDTTREGMESLLYSYYEVADHMSETDYIEPEDILHRLWWYEDYDFPYEEVTDDCEEYEFVPDIMIEL